MKIVFFMQDTGAIFGAERATLDLAAGLRDAGDTPVFFLIEESRMAGRPSRLQEEIRGKNLSLYIFPVKGRFSIHLAKSVRRTFLQIQGDILHIIGYKANLHALLSGVRPLVATVHGWLFRDDLKERLYDAVDRWCLRRCDRVICLSRHYEKLLLEYGILRECLSRVPSGLRAIPDQSELPPVPRNPKVPVFGMMGRFSEEKNHAMLLQAAYEATIECQDVRFILAGQGPLEDVIKAQISRLGIEGTVTTNGYTEVADFMRHIDVYVICSRMENLPYSIMEAMAWGKPVVGTAVGGIPDLVVDGETGMLVMSEDYHALAETIKLLCRNTALMAQQGAAGRARLTECFLLQQSIRRHRDIYSSLRCN